MGMWVADLYHQMQTPVLYRVSESLTVGQVVMREDTPTEPGEVERADAATAALNCLGCALDTVTYSAVQGDPEGLARLVQQPFSVWRFRVAGENTTGTALTTESPAQILTNTLLSAGGTLITAAEVGTVDMAGGLIKGRTGANGGVTRKLSAHTNSVSTAVTVPFPQPIGVGDTFIRLPFSRNTLAMQLAATAGSPASAFPLFSEAHGRIAFGTGIPVQVVNVDIDELRDEAFVDVVFRTALFNSLA